MKITYKPHAVNRSIVINEGLIGQIDCNQTMQYFGEWVSVQLPLNDDFTEFGELRLPYEYAKEHGLIIPVRFIGD